MISKFIIATDLSPASHAVVNCIGGIKKFGAQKCLLLQCLSFQEASSVAFSYSQDFLKNDLQSQKEILENEGFEVETRVVTGFAKREINRVALEENYSLIVVGSRGNSLMGGVFLGGVASEVIHNMRKPVLLVGLEVKDEKEECIEAVQCDFSQHILFPTDFSENADQAFKYVEKMAEEGANKITLLHVQDKSRIDPHLLHRLEEFNKIDQERLEKMKERLKEMSNADINIKLTYGSPVAEILRFSKENNVHLIAMGSQGRGIIQEVFLGSVSHSVSRNSNVSVLLIPPKEA